MEVSCFSSPIPEMLCIHGSIYGGDPNYLHPEEAHPPRIVSLLRNALGRNSRRSGINLSLGFPKISFYSAEGSKYPPLKTNSKSTLYIDGF